MLEFGSHQMVSEQFRSNGRNRKLCIQIDLDLMSISDEYSNSSTQRGLMEDSFVLEQSLVDIKEIHHHIKAVLKDCRDTCSDIKAILRNMLARLQGIQDPQEMDVIHENQDAESQEEDATEEVYSENGNSVDNDSKETMNSVSIKGGIDKTIRSLVKEPEKIAQPIKDHANEDVFLDQERFDSKAIHAEDEDFQGKEQEKEHFNALEICFEKNNGEWIEKKMDENAAAYSNERSINHKFIGDVFDDGNTVLQKVERSIVHNFIGGFLKNENMAAQSDPFDVEAQKKIEVAIDQKGMDEYWEAAIEYNTEAFVLVVMLGEDMEVNGMSLKVFIDSEAIQEVYKIFVKNTIIIWNWFYKDFVRNRKEATHPGQWYMEWMIAWIFEDKDLEGGKIDTILKSGDVMGVKPVHISLSRPWVHILF